MKQGEILTLNDNKKYTVVFTTKYENDDYIYLVDQNNFANNMFCKCVNNNGLEEVTDIHIIEQLLVLFAKSN